MITTRQEQQHGPLREQRKAVLGYRARLHDFISPQTRVRDRSALTLCVLLFPLLTAFCGQAWAIDEAVAETPVEEQVTFYTTYGYLQGEDWVIPLRIWVHEGLDLKRRGLAKIARAVLAKRAGLDGVSDEEAELFEQHSEGFLADSESRESVRFSFDDDAEHREYFLGDGEQVTKTDFNGLVEGTLRLEKASAARLLEAQGSNGGWLRFSAVSDGHEGIGWVRLIPPVGRSVISDIDDTIKVTEITAGESVVLRNTFFREFAAAPCMAELYRTFGDEVAFHYVSGGPWQMYEPLDRFLFTEPADFPRGSFHMKNLRLNPFEKESYEDIWTLIANGSQQVTFDQKVSQIRAIMQHFPGRTFTLIGDSGERDPEVFRQIREEFPQQVREIIIRVVSGDASTTPDQLQGMTRIPAIVSPGTSCSGLIGIAGP